MPGSKIPPRLTWAVEQLELHPNDRVLEIGCGPGIAASLVCERLEGGHLTAIDRSPSAIAAARQRNSECIKAGKATFLAASLNTAGLRPAAFHRAYAINVNIFWLDPVAELAMIRRVLRPDGLLLLVYHPPAASKILRITSSCSRFLRESGFSRVSTRVAEGYAIPIVSISGFA